ncbi:MAG: polyprenyl diphosphate synthase [Pseudomonadota bacterium]
MSDSPATAAPVAPAANDLRGGAKHVAIIMDGNHRWARARHLPGAAGHRAGARNVRRVAEACADAGVECLTLFAFSTENWHRPRPEVSLLMDLMRSVLKNDLEELHRRAVRLRVIGDRARFAPDLQNQMAEAERRTEENGRMTLNIAANFGGRWDIVQAARRLAQDHAAGRVALDAIDETRFESYLSLGALPPPDLCIRTGGDHRISNFLLWDFAYTEFFFTTKYWPDFDDQAIQDALDSFVDRQRRYGRRG